MPGRSYAREVVGADGEVTVERYELHSRQELGLATVAGIEAVLARREGTQDHELVRHSAIAPDIGNVAMG